MNIHTTTIVHVVIMLSTEKMTKHKLKLISNEKFMVALVSLLLFSTGFLRGGVQLVLADISGIYNIGAAGVGILVAVQYISPIIMPPVMGFVADKNGKKSVLILFTLIFSAGCIICGVSEALWVFIIGIVLYKSGSAVCESVSTAVLSDLNQEKSQQYINFTQFFFSTGAVAGPLVVQFFMDKYKKDWRFPFYLSAVVFAVIALLTFYFAFPENKQNKKNGKELSDKPTGKSYFSFITPLFIFMFLAILLYNGMECGLGSYIDSLFDEKFSGSTANAIAISCYWAGMSIVRIILGAKKYSSGKMLRICFLFSAAATAVLYFTKAVPVAVITCLVIGMLYSPIWCTIMSVSANNSDGNSGAAVGWMTAACGVGGVIIPGTMGIVTASSNVTTSLIVIIIASVTGALLCMKVRD